MAQEQGAAATSFARRSAVHAFTSSNALCARPASLTPATPGGNAQNSSNATASLTADVRLALIAGVVARKLPPRGTKPSKGGRRAAVAATPPVTFCLPGAPLSRASLATANRARSRYLTMPCATLRKSSPRLTSAPRTANAARETTAMIATNTKAVMAKRRPRCPFFSLW